MLIGCRSQSYPRRRAPSAVKTTTNNGAPTRPANAKGSCRARQGRLRPADRGRGRHTSPECGQHCHIAVAPQSPRSKACARARVEEGGPQLAGVGGGGCAAERVRLCRATQRGGGCQRDVLSSTATLACGGYRTAGARPCAAPGRGLGVQDVPWATDERNERGAGHRPSLRPRERGPGGPAGRVDPGGFLSPDQTTRTKRSGIRLRAQRRRDRRGEVSEGRSSGDTRGTQPRRSAPTATYSRKGARANGDPVQEDSAGPGGLRDRQPGVRREDSASDEDPLVENS